MPEKFLFIAEDDTDDQDFLIEALRQIDPEIKIHVENAGDKALEFLLSVAEDQAPHLILLDFNLPKLNGQQILAQLSNLNRLTGVTKLVWSTSNSPLYEKACLEAGAKAYIVKPADVSGIDRVARVVLDHID